MNPDALAPVAVVTASAKRLNRWVNARRRHHPTAASIDTPPADIVDLTDVCAALLEGLGKNSQLWQGKSSTVTLARAWLSLGETTDVIIVDAQLLRIRLLDEVVDLLAVHGVRAWLVVSGKHPRHLEVVTGRGGRAADEDELRATFPDGQATRKTPPPPTVRLPRVQGFVFRSTCRDLLSADEFADVDARFCATVRALRSEIAEVDGRSKSRQVVRLVRNRFNESGDTDDLLLVACAAQVAALPHAFLVTVHLPTLLGAAETLPRVGRAVPDRWWERLDSYREPSVGAIAALYHADIHPDSIRYVDRHAVIASARPGASPSMTAATPPAVRPIGERPTGRRPRTDGATSRRAGVALGT